MALGGKQTGLGGELPAQPSNAVTICPKCGGQKYVNKPPYIAGDQHSWVAGNTGGFTCPVCHGKGFIYA